MLLDGNLLTYYQRRDYWKAINNNKADKPGALRDARYCARAHRARRAAPRQVASTDGIQTIAEISYVYQIT